MLPWRQEALLRCTQPEPDAALRVARSSDTSSASSRGGGLRVAFRGGVHDSHRALVVPVQEGGGRRTILTLYQLGKPGESSAMPRTPVAIGEIVHAWPLRCAAWAGNALVVGGSAGRIAVMQAAPEDDRHDSAADEMIEVALPGAQELSAIRVPPSRPASSAVVTSLALDADGAFAAAASSSAHVFTTVGDPTPHYSWTSPQSSVVTAVATCGTGGAILAAGTVDGRVHLLDTRRAPTAEGASFECGARGGPSPTARCSSRFVEDVAFSPVHRNLLAVTRSDGSLQLFDTRRLRHPLLSVADAADGLATQVAFAPCTSDVLAVGSSSGIARLWSIRDATATLRGTAVRGGDAVVSLHHATIDDCDSFVCVDRAGGVHTSTLTADYLRNTAPRFGGGGVSAAGTASTPGADAAHIDAAAAALAVQRLDEAAAAYYRRDIDVAIRSAMAAVRSALEAGDASLASRASEALRLWEWEAPGFEDTEVPTVAMDDAEDATTSEDTPANASSRVALAAGALLARPFAITPATLRYAAMHGDDRTRDALARALQPSAMMRSQLEASEREVGFVKALETGDAELLRANVAQIVSAIMTARLQPELIGGATRLLLGAQYVEEILELLSEMAKGLSGGDPTRRPTTASLPHASAVYAVLLEPMAPTKAGPDGVDWLEASVGSCDEAAAFAEVIAAWIGFDAGVRSAQELVDVAREFAEMLPELEGGVAAIPAPTLVSAVAAAMLEVNPDSLKAACELVEAYGQAVAGVSRIPVGMSALEAEDREAEATALSAAEGDLRSLVADTVDAHVAIGADHVAALSTTGQAVHSHSSTQRMAAESQLEELVSASAAWLRASLELRTALTPRGVAAAADSGGCTLRAPLWEGYDPLEELEGTLIDVLEAWTALLAEVRDDRPLRAKVQPTVERLAGDVEGIASAADVSLEADEGAMLAALLDECADFLDPPEA